jgi:uncharacterized protein YbjQ (UPF0145 family)
LITYPQNSLKYSGYLHKTLGLFNGFFLIERRGIAHMITNPQLITTAFELEGYRVVQNLGIVRGIVVRSRSVVGNFVGGIQSLFGGNITIYTEMCEHARQEAFDIMIAHANQEGANGIIGFRYDATEVMEGLTEVLAYGTACRLEKI